MEDRWLYDLLAEGMLPGITSDTSFATKDALYGSYGISVRNGRGWPKTKARFAQWLTDRLGSAVKEARPRENGAAHAWLSVCPARRMSRAVRAATRAHAELAGTRGMGSK